MPKKTIIFYNPLAPYYTLPLQYLALASVIDKNRYDIRVIDARIEKSARHAHDKVKELLPHAACIGVSIITGTPIKDAVAISQLVKSHAPHVPVVWGGWHPSIYPEQCLREGSADYCVLGQGEETFLELLDALESGRGFESILGLAYLNGKTFHQNPPRKFVDINKFPAYDYDLVPLETYFKLKGRRQLDFYSSQGCPYRCAFCADPYVYNRRWSGLRGSRMLFDVFDAVKKYRIEDVHFQDENFFANRNRVSEFCKGIDEHRMTFSWAATSRADQIAPLDDAFLTMAAGSHLRKVLIGAESGSQEMLDLMKKDTLTEETIISAEKLAQHGIGGAFNFIVGFPEEGFENTLKTLATIKEIKRINPEFEFSISFFTPFPGTELFNYIERKGYRVPRTIAEWSDIDFITYAGYWLKEEERQYVERFKFYTRFGTERTYARGFGFPLHVLAATRCKHNYYKFPVERELVNFIRYKVLQQPTW